MAKKYQSGVFLGETRRQRTARMRNFCVILVLVLLTVLGSVFFVSWLLDRSDSVQTGNNLPPVAEQTDTDTAADTERNIPETETDAPEETTPEATPDVPEAVVAVTGTPYKPLYYTRTWAVMIDPGHGFDDIGTSSALLGDVNEATINLDIALRVRELLSEHKEIAVLMTHDDNAVDGRISAADGGEPPLNNLVLLTPEDRAVLANGQDIDLFVSLHCDSIPDKPEISGMRAYYYDSGDTVGARDAGAEALATNIANQFGLKMGNDAPTPMVKTMTDDNAFYVIKNIDVPSVLCEVGFVTNQTDAKQMLDETWRQAAAEAIVNGIIEYIHCAVH